MDNVKKILIILILIMIAGGCAKKAPPVSWDTVLPKRIVDLQAIPREGKLFLEWTVPKENTDKTPFMDLAGFQLMRSEGTLVGGECQGCVGQAKVISEIKTGPQQGEGVEKKKMQAVIEDQVAGRIYVYQIVSVNRRGYGGSPSNPVTVYWDVPPDAPSVLKAESVEKWIDLSWTPVSQATGYNLYRKEEGGTFTLNPLNREIIATTQYRDLDVKGEKKYVYTVRAVKTVVKNDVEGKGSLEVSLALPDINAPDAPTGLTALATKEGVELKWAKNSELDLRGYHVYRQKTGEKKFKRLNKNIIGKESYLDTTCVLGGEYEYAVTAVDYSSRVNESSYSEKIKVKYTY
jgi:hypothetical protein